MVGAPVAARDLRIHPRPDGGDRARGAAEHALGLDADGVHAKFGVAPTPVRKSSRIARVKAGQLIAYNGDSGDAEGIYHLHFEVHPNDGTDVDPFPYLNAATRLLFALPTRP